MTRLLAFVAVVAAGLAGWAGVDRFQSDRPAVAGTITKVVDGDTLDVAGAGRVRILLVDAPETHDNSHGAKGCFALAAKDRLAALAPVGTPVSLTADVGPFDKYGRALRYVEAGGVDVGRQLVVEGLATVAYYPPNRARLDTYTSDEAAAKSSALNIWSATCAP